jgi:5'(3')-deoxyribonucleotidase
MKKQTIAIDIDDVLANHVEAFNAFSNKTYGTDLTIEDYSDRWADFWDLSDDEIEKRALEFQTQEEIAGFKVKDESKEALEQLKENYDLVIVTARRKHIVDTTIKWLDKYFPEVFKGIHFVPIWVPSNKITKGDICKQVGADYLIDDVPKHCNLAAEVGIKAILFGDYSWNRNTEIAKDVVRCKDWQSVLNYFNYKQHQVFGSGHRLFPE